MKFALVTADSANNVKFKMNGESDDCTGFMNWISIWDGVLYSFQEMRKDCSVLFNYDCVMFSGNPAYIQDLVDIAIKLKGKVVTMFLPEGDVSLYDQYGINSFSRVIYDAWNSCDILASMEEDKISYYSILTKSLVKFIHVPIDNRMEIGEFRTSNQRKTSEIMIYGDNNPNCPITAFGIAGKLNKPVFSVCIDPIKLQQISELFDVKIPTQTSKLGQYPFLRMLGRCWISIYPTRWIGSSRQSIACAVARTPCIGTDRSHTQRRLFPKLACDIYDVNKMIDLANRLYNDLQFYDEVVDYAWDQVKFYNMENTKKRFMDAYNEIRDRWAK